MGLKLRYNLFFGVEADEVYAALESFWTERACQFITTALYAPPEARDQYELHESRCGWTLLGWDGGWEWELRRKAQLHVSQVLGCAGLLVFVYDGNYWGYELFNDGRQVDHFVQDPEAAGWFPGRPCSGQPELFAAQFPAARLRSTDIAPYLLPMPESRDADADWDAPARAGDQFTRGGTPRSYGTVRCSPATAGTARISPRRRSSGPTGPGAASIPTVTPRRTRGG